MEYHYPFCWDFSPLQPRRSLPRGSTVTSVCRRQSTKCPLTCALVGYPSLIKGYVVFIQMWNPRAIPFNTHTRFHCNFINLGFGSNLVGEKARNFPYDKPLSLLTHCWLWNWNSFGGVVVGVAGWLAGSKKTENINGQFSGIPKWNTLALLLFLHLVYISNQFNLKHFGQASHSVGTVCGGQHRFAADSIHKPLCWLLPGRCDVAIVTYVGDNWLWVEVDLEIREFNR